MAGIELLDEHLINQIKAGEVVESPHAMLKELIENSIDAGSTSLRIIIKNNGLDLVQIRDNGEGISFEELPLAFARHATSKIKQFGDIYKVYSYGFRGEALASISSIAKVNLTSQPTNALKSGRLQINGGEILNHDLVETEIRGTIINVESLFYNTPARLKFTRSKRTLRNQLNQILFSFVLTQPFIHFNIQFDSEEPIVFEPVPSKDNAKNSRAIQLVSILRKKSLLKNLVVETFSFERHDFELSICPHATKGGQKNQFIFVNDRLIEDKKLKAIINRKMSPSLWPIGCSGDYFLHIKVPAELIDPNVHPSKTIIKFIFPEIVESAISHLIDQVKKKNNNENVSTTSTSFSPVQTNFDNDQAKTIQGQVKNLPRNHINGSIDLENKESETKHYLTILSEDGIKIIHKVNLSKEFIKMNARYYNGESLPLLVALKLSIEPDPDFCNKLSPLGFEIEKDSDTNQFFLKEVPLYMTTFENLQMSVLIIEYLYKYELDLENFNKVIDKCPSNLFHIKNGVIINILKNEEIFLDNRKVCRSLSNDKIEEFFT